MGVVGQNGVLTTNVGNGLQPGSHGPMNFINTNVTSAGLQTPVQLHKCTASNVGNGFQSVSDRQ